MFTISYFQLQARLDRCPPEKGTKECIRTCLKAFRPLIQVLSLESSPIINWIKIYFRGIKLISIQACLLALALWISFSRVSDYFHHPLDVAVGAFVGVLMVVPLLVPFNR